MKERPILFGTEMVKAILEGRKTQTRRVLRDTKWYYAKDITHRYQLPHLRDCPYGQPGDRLWVREAWRPYSEREVRIEYKADGTIIDFPKLPWFFFYACGQAWHPSIHMPRWASRINLEITGVRVERVQEITIKDAIREGLCEKQYPVKEFAKLWDSLNAKRGYSWETNPWVWVIEFKRTTQ